MIKEFAVMPLGRYMKPKNISGTLKKSQEFFNSDMGAVLVRLRDRLASKTVQAVIFTAGKADKFVQSYDIENSDCCLIHNQTHQHIGSIEYLGTYQIVDGRLSDCTRNIHLNTAVDRVFAFK